MEKSTCLLLEDVRELYNRLDISISKDENIEDIIQTYWESMKRLNQEIAVSAAFFMSR